MDLTPKQLKRLTKWGKEASSLREHATSPHQCIVSVDIEAWEKDSSLILEIAFVIVSECRVITAINYIVTDRLPLQNKYTPRSHVAFKYGRTEKIHSSVLNRQIHSDLAECERRYQSVCLLAHNIQSDLRFIRLSGVVLSSQLLDGALDTQHVICATKNEMQSPKLSQCCLDYGLRFDVSELHNSGNDAWLTAHLALRVLKLV